MSDEPKLDPAVIFLDLETTGLDPERDVITEWAWIFERPGVGTLVERHFYVSYSGFPTLWAARNTAAWDRMEENTSLSVVASNFFQDCLNLSANGTRAVHLVGACPFFDDAFIRKVYREVPYHFHVIDVEAMAMGALRLRYPKRLKELREALGIPGENPNPHFALDDAREAKIIYDAVLART